MARMQLQGKMDMTFCIAILYLDLCVFICSLQASGSGHGDGRDADAGAATEQDGLAPDTANGAASQGARTRRRANGTGSQQEDDAQQKQQQQQQQEGPPPVDTWAEHLENTISEAQATALGAQGGRAKFVDVSHPDHEVCACACMCV